MERSPIASALFALMTMSVLASTSGDSLAAAQPTPAREEIPLTDGWRFKLDGPLNGAESPQFPDANWEAVTVPHTWNRVGLYLNSLVPHLNTAANINKAQGTGWYRLSFTPPADVKGKRAWLQFDAVSRMATVWMNGVYVGEHKGGFSRFRLDVTDALKPGAVNVVAVRADNSDPAVGATTADILPLTGDFFVHGGLYRPVSLIVTDPAHIDMMDFGGPGVYAVTEQIRGEQATVKVRTKLRNDGNRVERLKLRTRLLDANRQVAAEQTLPAIVKAHANAEAEQTLGLSHARLWRGVVDPYLYTLQTELLAGDGSVRDRTEQSFGVRQIRIDPDKGVFLNGAPLRLHGTGYHQDREGKGWAISAQDTAEDFAMLREMGANTLRLTHYQHGQPIHELADRYGFILWDEIPLVSKWTLAPGQREATPELRANARQQLQELIRQNFNHASVAVWGVANEVDFGNSLPGFLTGNSDEPPDPMPLLRELNALAKTEDATRPTSLATCCEGRVFAPGAAVPTTAMAVDVSGANRYFGWYFGKPDDVGPHLDSLHALRPTQPQALTEYGAGGAISLHTDNPLGGPVSSRGREQPEEYMSYVHERNWAALKTKSYLWATWLWNSFDFATTIRREGDADDINTKGLITYDRKVKKDPYYFYQANWTQTPTVHINSRRYTDRAYASTDVRVYSNAPATELVLNGRSQGSLTRCPDSVCVWRNVSLDVGANELVAKGRFAENTVEDRVSWTLSAAVADAVRIDSGSLMGTQTPSGRFGSDNFFTGGSADSVNKAADFGRPAVAKNISNAANPGIAASYREGEFAYRIPLRNGAYTVRLTFVEPGLAAGERSFDVTANGAVKLSQLDITAVAGTLNAIVRSFEVRVENGELDLEFKREKGKAIVSAVEVLRK